MKILDPLLDYLRFVLQSPFNRNILYQFGCSRCNLIHKFGNVGIFVLLKFENMLDREINPLNFNSKHYDKCKYSLKHTGFLTVSNLFSLEFVQKCLKCQLCALRKNSTSRVNSHRTVDYVNYRYIYASVNYAASEKFRSI